MTRIKHGFASHRRHKRILARTKGYRWGRSKQFKAAVTASMKAGRYAYRDRRNRKRDFRALWIIRINAAARELGLNYRDFARRLRNARIGLDRKILAHLAFSEPAVFKRIVEEIRTTPSSPK